jgi:hypothetical protein
VIDQLYLRVIALSDGSQRAMIISFDLDKAPNPALWLPKLEEHTGVPAANITYLGTHTHSAPFTTFRPRERTREKITPVQQQATVAYEDFVFQQLMAAVDEAWAALRPARMGFGTGESYINVNRNEEYLCEVEGQLWGVAFEGQRPEVPVDRTLFVLKIEEESGAPIAFFVNYPVHCCVMFLNRYDQQGSMGISGDIAGTVSQYMEEKFPGSVAVWSSGAAGDVDPVITNEMRYPDPKDGNRKVYMLPDWQTIYQLMIFQAARHFADIQKVLRGIQTTTDDVTLSGAVCWSETPAYASNTPFFSTALPTEGEGEPYRIRMHLLRIGEVALCGIGGELYNGLGKLLKEQAALPNTVIINHEASLIQDAGYILDDDTLARVRRVTPIRGMIPGFGTVSKAGYVGPSLVAHLQELFDQVLP